MTVQRIKEHDPSEWGMSITRSTDGVTFSSVTVVMSDGTERGLWTSSADANLYRRVFVRWDYENPNLIEL